MSKRKGLSALAAELGISRQAVSKLAQRGMPTHDPDAAREWRRRKLNPAKTAPDPGPSPATLVARVHRLRDLTVAARDTGHLDLVLEPLRAALQAVPESHSDQVQMQPWLWAALIGEHAMNVLNEGARSSREMPADEADEDDVVGDWVFKLATGQAAIR
jgi:hypothetical protein